MTRIYLKAATIVGSLLFACFSFGQFTQQPNINFVNPFQRKANLVPITPLTPVNSTDSKFQLKPQIELTSGSFSVGLEKQRINREGVVNSFNGWFGLNGKHTFKLTSERTDELGFTHTSYQQLFDGFLIDGSLIMLHSTNDIVTSINGQIADFDAVETQSIVTPHQAQLIAKSYLKVKDLINDYPVETVITRMTNEKRVDYKLTQKVRIDSYSPFEMCLIYVDGKTGEVLNKVNLIAHADVAGTGQTMYSGSQPITCDNFTSGGYRLRESGRKIETYNATNATNLTTSGFTGSTDFTNNSTTFTGVPVLNSFTISTVAQSWWYAAFVDQKPDLYIRVKNGLNQVVYTSNYYNDQNPSVTFNLNIYMSNPPYTVELWDYDAGSDDDFGGTYSISTNVGNQNWSGSGNSGNYVIANAGHPAIDVHWGMEKTYDFYSAVFSRTSYDGNGSVIKQYVNPLIMNGNAGYPNNASALPSPYNLMSYGMGDGIDYSPLVGLDVEGHEFTHLVVNNNGNGGLTYQAESGALNESFADIFGTCVEFYSGVNPDWNIGEDVMIGQPFMRSMSNPNSRQHPDTYQGQYWVNTANTSPENDKGGVHTNSGVQNFWFYLLSQGGSGTNDLGKAYSVSGIGITKARQIAYRNLITYLGPNATYVDAYNGSLRAAQDLYGNPSSEYTAVRQAWYAVGIGNDPNNYCSGTTSLTASTGTITDGSGSANYNDNANCKWIIAPPGATRITLNFTSFDTEDKYDTVFVYDGPDDTYQRLATWWGNSLPPTITTTAGVGAMCIKFKSDINTTAAGWSANYSATTTTPSCGDGILLPTPTGSISDGSGSGNYGNNQLCYWFIAPPCANTITLSFSQFNTELNYDGVVIFDGWGTANQLAAFSGTSIPSPVTSTTGKMVVAFVSDYSNPMQGFTASYSSTGSAYCSGTSNLSTSDYGTITDGSGNNNYCNNLDCRWLIQPPQATKVTLDFTAFDLEQASTDGQTINDAVEIYDGSNTSAPLLGKFTGSSIPPSISSTGGSMLVRFLSNIEVNKQGFTANYTSIQNSYCTGTATMTSSNGSLSDGSATNQYANNSNCSWLIQPPGASSITLSFSEFNTEVDYDGVIVYDGINNTMPILGKFSGSSLPSSVTSTGGSMYVEFLSDRSLRGNGWTANYTSSIATNVKEMLFSESLELYPNPCKGNFTVKSELPDLITVQIMDLLGKQVLSSHTIKTGINQVDAPTLSDGLYLLRFKIGDKYLFNRIAVTR